MKIEGYSEKDMSNVTTLKNAIEARHIYERARLENPTRDRIPMSRGPLKIGVDPTIYTIITGIEAGARQELYSEGHHTVVHEIYKAQEKKEAGSGE